MADIVVVVPGSQPITKMKRKTKDNLWIIFTDKFDWEPDNTNSGFYPPLLPCGTHGTANQNTAFGPFVATSKATVNFYDPPLKKGQRKKPLSGPHSITIS